MWLMLLVFLGAFVLIPPLFTFAFHSRFIMRSPCTNHSGIPHVVSQTVQGTPEDELARREKQYALYKRYGNMRWLMLIACIYFISIQEETPRFPLLFSLVLLASYLAVFSANIVGWGIIYRKVNKLAFRLIDYLKFHLASLFLVRGLFFCGLYFCLLELFLLSGDLTINTGLFLSAAIPVSIALIIITAVLPADIGHFLGIITFLPKERFSGGIERELAKVRRIGVLKTYGIPFPMAWSFYFSRDIMVTDYFLNNFTEGEVKSILVHEAGHLQSRSDFVYRALGILAGLFFLLYYYWIFKWLSLQYSWIFFWVGAVLFASLRARISWVFEREADDFVLTNPEAAKDYPSALQRLYQTGILPLRYRYGKGKEIYPTLQNRLKKFGMELVPTEDEKVYLNKAKWESAKAWIIFFIICGVYILYLDYYNRHIKSGLEYFDNANYQAAAEEFSKETQEHHYRTLGHYWLALAYGRLLRWDDAIAELEAALKIDPNHKYSRKYLDEIRDYLKGKKHEWGE